MNIANILKFASLKDTFIKGAILAIAATIAITFGSVGQAAAHSGTISGWVNANQTYQMTIQNYWGHTCVIQYQMGNAWTVAYAKFRILSSTDTCSVGIWAHTVGNQPGAYKQIHWNHQSWQGWTSWYQSGHQPYTNFAYASMFVALSNYPFDTYFDVNLSGNDSGAWVSVSNCYDYCSLY